MSSDTIIAADAVMIEVISQNYSTKFMEMNWLCQFSSGMKELLRPISAKNSELIQEAKKRHNMDQENRRQIDHKLATNYGVYTVLVSLLEDSMVSKGVGENIRLDNLWVELNVRLNQILDQKEALELKDKIKHGLSDFSRLLLRADQLRKASSHQQSLQHALTELHHAGSDYTESGIPLPAEIRKGIDQLVEGFSNPRSVCGWRITTIGNIHYFIRDNLVFPMLTAHVGRLITSMISMFNVGFSIHLEAIASEPVKGIEKCIKWIKRVKEDDPESVPLVFKGLRQYVIALNDHTHIVSADPAADLLGSMNEIRKKYVREIFLDLSDVFPDKVNMINVSNIYKGLPHPDTDLDLAFDDLNDLKKPNRADPLFVARFEGKFREELFNSLRAMGYYCTLRKAENVESEVPLVSESLSSSSKHDQLINRSSVEWQKSRINHCREIPGLSDMEVRVSSKSSTIDLEATREDFAKFESESRGRKISMRSDDKFVLDCKLSVNDVVSSLKGESNLRYETGHAKLSELVHRHISFEESLGVKCPEDVPSDLLEEMVWSDPRNRHYVGTEPKFGEKHKRETRMFYMAQQPIKAILQRMERQVRLMTSKQGGVSIVKTNRGRKTDLHRFCKTMGSSEGIGNDGELSGWMNVYVSFDMEKFSKKFPMELVRAAGRVLAEATGEVLYERIDVIFRSAVVFHKSRGTFRFMAGIKGGFEGFLNFLWSSIHAVVMKLSLETQGLRGDLAAFSDDGLLRFLVKQGKSRSDIRNIVDGIQRCYRRCGLEFSLIKTLISADIWEFLGDVAFRGSLIPMWVKESTAIASVLPQKGFNSALSRIEALNGQADAMVAAGMNPLNAFIIKFIHFQRILERNYGITEPVLTAIMSIVPASLGGLRISSPLEMAISSSIGQEISFLEDIDSLEMVFNGLGYTLVNHWSDNLIPPRNILKSIMSGTMVKCGIPSCTGNSINNKIVEMIIDRTGAKIDKDPFESGSFDSVLEFVKSLEVVDPEMIRRLLMSLPEWASFNETMSLVRSSAAIGFIDRDTIRKAQAADRMTVRRSADHYSHLIRKKTTGNMVSAMASLLSRSQDICCVGIPIMRQRSGYMNYISRCVSPDSNEGSSDIVVTCSQFDTIHGMSLNVPYIFTTPSNPVGTIEWSGEKTASKSQAGIRKLLKFVSMTIAKHPDSIGAMGNLMLSHGIALPQIQMVDAVNPQRRSSRKLRDSETRGRPVLTGILSSSYSPGGYSIINGIDRVDILLPLIIAKTLTSMRLCSLTHSIRPGKVNGSVVCYSFNVDPGIYAAPYLRSKKEVRMPTSLKVLSKEMQMEFRATLHEEIQSVAHHDALESYSSGVSDLSVEERGWVEALSTEKASRWIQKALICNSDLKDFSSFPELSPSSPVICLVRAAIRATSRSYSRAERTRVLGSLNSDMDEGRTGVIGEFTQRLNLSLKVALSVVRDPSLRSLFSSYMQQGELMTDLVRKELKMSLDYSEVKRYVVRDSTFVRGKVDQSYARLMREIFSISVTNLYQEGISVEWKDTPERAISELDMKIDACTAACELTRPSEHRSTSHPFNQKSLMIEMGKLYLLLDTNIALKTPYLGLPTVERLSPFQKSRLIKDLGLHGLGTDHNRMISDKLQPSLARRLSWYLDSEKSNYENFIRGTKIFLEKSPSRVRRIKEYRKERWFAMGDTFEKFATFRNSISSFIYNDIISVALRNTVMIDYTTDRYLSTLSGPRRNPTVEAALLPKATELVTLAHQGDVGLDALEKERVTGLLREHMKMMEMKIPGLKVNTSGFYVKTDTAECMVKAAHGYIVESIDEDTFELTNRLARSLTSWERKDLQEKKIKRGKQPQVSLTQKRICPIFMMTDNLKLAVNDYTSCMQSDMCSLSFFKDPGRGLYIICGLIVNPCDFLSRANKDELLRSLIDYDVGMLENFIPQATILDATTAIGFDVRSIHSLLTSQYSSTVDQSYTLLEAGVQFGTKRMQIVEDDSILYGVLSTLAPGAGYGSIAPGCVGLLALALYGKPADPQTFYSDCQAIRDSIKAEVGNKQAIAKLKQAVGVIYGWRRSLIVNPGSEIDIEVSTSTSLFLESSQMTMKVNPTVSISSSYFAGIEDIYTLPLGDSDLSSPTKFIDLLSLLGENLKVDLRITHEMTQEDKKEIDDMFS